MIRSATVKSPLTEAKALALVGKVRLQSEGVENVTTSGASKKLKDENSLLIKRVEELELEVEKFGEKVDKFTEYEQGLLTQITDLTKANEDLVAEAAKGSDK